MPAWLQQLAHLVPTAYAIEGLRQAMFYPGLEGVPTDLAVLFASALLATGLGSVALRRSWATR